MSLRMKFFDAMRRKREDYIPFEFKLCPSLVEKFKQMTGMENYEEFYQFPTRGLSAESKQSDDEIINIFSQYYHDLKDIRLNEWGVGFKKGSVAHFTKMQHPMESFESIEEFEQYPYPDPIDLYDWNTVQRKAEEIKNRDLIVVAHMETTVFEIAWYLRGIDQFMVDMMLNPKLMEYHLNRITKIRCDHAARYAQAGFDVLRLGDDVSTQLDMMMNPDTWREIFKPRLAQVIQSAKSVKPDILIFYHGDGNLQKIIPDLIEVGVEILNPVQPECMDPVVIKDQYGDKLSFWGTLGTQTTMPFGTPEEVKRVCLEMIEKAGRGGGLLLAPTHMLEPEVTLENIQAFIDTVCEYNNKAMK